eukprot:2022265-Rhodomonas_salina.2
MLRAAACSYDITQVQFTTSLRASYAMSGTDLPYGTLLSSYARATRCPVITYSMVLPADWAQAGYLPTRSLMQCPVLTLAMLLPGLVGTTMPGESAMCLGIAGTDRAYAARRIRY